MSCFHKTFMFLFTLKIAGLLPPPARDLTHAGAEEGGWRWALGWGEPTQLCLPYVHVSAPGKQD